MVDLSLIRPMFTYVSLFKMYKTKYELLESFKTYKISYLAHIYLSRKTRGQSHFKIALQAQQRRYEREYGCYCFE
jgi:hypothetical protein